MQTLGLGSQLVDQMTKPPRFLLSIIPGVQDFEIARRFAERKVLIQWIPRFPIPIKKSVASYYVDSPLVDAIVLVEMLRKFNYPDKKMFDEETDPDNHIAQYHQRMFIAGILRVMGETCICKGFGSSLIGITLQWYTNLPNNSIPFA